MAGKQQGSPNVDLDLDVELAELDLAPVAVRLGGHVYTVRRDLTVVEIRAYWELAATKDDAGCLGQLVGGRELGEQLNDALEAMPRKRMELALKKIMSAAGLIDESGEKRGEVQAS